MTAARAKPPFEIRGVHVLWGMLAFFGAIIAINVAFSIAAVQTFPGEDVRRSYLQGLHYNETLAERRAQAALGWRATAELAETEHGATVIVRILDRDNAGLNLLELTGTLRRPLDARADVPLAFVAAGDGVYRATLEDLPPGAWDLRVEARRGDARFDLARRLVWRPSTRP